MMTESEINILANRIASNSVTALYGGNRLVLDPGSAANDPELTRKTAFDRIYAVVVEALRKQASKGTE